MFRALLLEKNGDFNVSICDLTDESLPIGDITVDVEYSTVNYKDGLAVTDSSPVIRSWPMVPGIDLAGRVIESKNNKISVGTAVVVNGWGIGEKSWGGFAQRARLQADWVVPIPEVFTTAQAMAIGTAGFTAMLCVLALEEHYIFPDTGPILVTGASGGVGSVTIALLAGLGYEVHASTGRLNEADYLRALGAKEVFDRNELSEPSNRPLNSAKWAGAVDTVGSHTLANLLTQILPEGCVAACGNARGMDLSMTVAPFILRGVTLRGVHSVNVPFPRRSLVWERLANDLDVELLNSMVHTISLEQIPEICDDIVAGRVRGRIVVDVNR